MSPIKSITKHASNVTYADDGISSLRVSFEVVSEETGLFKLEKKSLATLINAAAAIFPKMVPIRRELKVSKNAPIPCLIASCCVVIVFKVLESEKSTGTSCFLDGCRNWRWKVVFNDVALRRIEKNRKK